MRAMGITLRLGEKVAKIEEVSGNGSGRLMQATLESGKKLSAETLLYSVGRQGTADTLCLDKCGLCADDRGRLKVNGDYQTEVAHIYAAGDVIGFPALASTSMEQGRLAACHAFGAETRSIPELIHIGQAVMAFNGTVEFFINNVFNFPTLAEAYKVAALNGLNKFRHICA